MDGLRSLGPDLRPKTPSDMIGHSFPTLEEKPYIPTMPKIRIIPAIAIVTAIVVAFLPTVHGQPGAAAPSPAPATPASAAAPVEPPNEVELFLDAAIKKVAAYTSVMADIIEKVDMLDQKFQLQGKYRKAPNDKVYLQLAVSGMRDAEGIMLQVCDGTTLWDYQKVFKVQVYRRLDAAPILTKLRTYDLAENLRENIMTQLGFAGPEVLLASLRKTIKFDQKAKGTLDGRSVWILGGTWTSHEGLVGPNSQPLPLLANLPSYVPSLVKVYLGEDDSWPYRVELLSQPGSVLIEDTRPIGLDGKRQGSKGMRQKSLLTTIELSYTNVKLGTPVPDKEFLFQAPQGEPVEDDTKKILDALEMAASQRAAEKKSEAAKGGGDLLNQTIPIPDSLPGGEPLPAIPPR